MRFLFSSKKTTETTVKKLSLIDRWKGVAYENLKNKDVAQLLKSEKLASGLGVAPLHTSHPLRAIALKLKSDVNRIDLSSIKGLSALEARIVKENMKHSLVYSTFPIDDSTCEHSDENYWKFQTALRLDNLTRYCSNLKSSINSGEIDEKIVVNEKKLTELIDASLLGSGSERVSAHMRMYGPTFTQNSLQSCFYTIFNAEVDSTMHALSNLPLVAIKEHKKTLTKSAKVYLLDKLELNSKSRCVFAWADPNYAGFDPLDDASTMPAEEVILSRQKYFEEGSMIAKMFVESYVAERRVFYTDKDEMRFNIRYGSIFLFCTIMADWFVCVM